MKIYIVIWQKYEFMSIEKAFYSKCDAEKFIEEQNRKFPNEEDYLYIDETEIC